MKFMVSEISGEFSMPHYTLQAPAIPRPVPQSRRRSQATQPGYGTDRTWPESLSQVASTLNLLRHELFLTQGQTSRCDKVWLQLGGYLGASTLPSASVDGLLPLAYP
jgi:hypothetical protein